jgi:hypothetical protein
MAKVCKGGFHAPDGEWQIPYSPYGEGEKACVDSGGTVVEQGGGCGSTSAMQRVAPPGAQTGDDGLVNGAFAPALKLRDSLVGTDLVRDLDLINDSPEVPEIITANPAIAQRLGAIVSIASGVSVDLLLGDDPIGLTYSEDLHKLLTDVATDVRAEVTDEQVATAIDNVLARMEGYLGAPVGDVYRSLRGQVS